MLRLRSSWERYGLAAAATTLASLSYFLARPSDLDSDLIYFGFTLAVLLTSVVAGLGPAVLATALSTLTVAYFLIPPMFSIQIEAGERTARLLLFIGEAVLLSIVGNRLYDVVAEDDHVPWRRRYQTMAMLVIGATIVKLLAWRNAENEMPFAIYYVVVAASAWAGGFGAGIAATLLSSLCARFFFIDPLYSFSVHSPAAAGRVLLFIAEGIVISALVGMTARVRLFAGRVVDEMRNHSKRLWKGAEDSHALRAISRDIIWEWDFPSASKLPAKETDEALNSETSFSGWLQQVHPKDRLKILASLKAAMEEKRSEWSAEYRRLLPGRGYIRVADRASIIRDNSWNPVRVIGRSAEVPAPGLQSEGAYRAFFDSSPQATLLADSVLHILDANDAACDVLGYTRDGLKRLTLADLIPGSARGILLELSLEDPSAIIFEEDCVRASGEVFRAKISAALVSGVDQLYVDRIITIEEMGEAVG